MLILKAVTAYTAAMQLMEQELDYKTAHALVLLKKRLQPHVDYYLCEEMKLARACGRKDENGNVVFTDSTHFDFESPQAGEEYMTKRTELAQVDIQEEWEKIKCPCPEKIKPAVLEALQDFIEFGGD